MRRGTVHSILLAALIIASIWLHIFPHAYATTSYSPGVKVGDSITYGRFRVNNTSPYSPQYVNVSSVTIQIKNIVTSTNTVIASLITTFLNGSQASGSLNGTTDVQNGNLLPYVIAGSLTAGDPLWKNQSPYNPLSVNETVNRVYAGALRTVNLVNLTYQSYYQSSRASLYWDAKTGLLLEASENATYNYSSGHVVIQLYFVATATNIWTPDSSPDFGLDASAQTAGPHLGETTSYRLDLASLNFFNGTISLEASLVGAVPANSLIISLSSTTVSVSSQNLTASSILTIVSSTSTPLGAYLIGINATGGLISHQAIIAVDIAAPDYSIAANPGNLTLSQGTSKNSTITVKALGAFTGTVSLQAYTQFYNSFNNSPFTALLSPNVVSLSSTSQEESVTLTVTSPPGGPPAAGGVSVNAVGDNLYRSTFVAVNVTGPDFRLTATPYFLSFKEGESATSAITLTSILGFAGRVGLSVSTYGPVTATLPSSSLNLTAGGTANTNVTFSVPPSGPPGFYSAYVTGTSGNIQHSVYFNLNVTGPDFRFTTSLYSVTLQQGQSANTTLSLTGVGGFTGTILLSNNVYGPLNAFSSPSSITLDSTHNSATALLTVTAPAGAAPGFYSVQISAVSGSITHSIYFGVQVIGPDFSIFTSPSSLSIPQGGSGQATISLSSIDNFSGAVQVSASTYPPQSLQLSLSSSFLQLSPGGVANSTLTVQVPLTTTVGYYFVSVYASSGQLSHSNGVEVHVTGPDFSVFSSPSFLTLAQGQSANSTITLTSLENFDAPVNITAFTYYPSLVTVSPKSSILTPARNESLTTTLTFSTSLNSPPGTYYFQIQATGGNLTRYTFVDVVVTGPDFSLSVNPNSVTLSPGSSSIDAVTLSSIEGFAGNVTLSASTFGLNATISDSVVHLSANGTTTTQLTIHVPAGLQSSGYSVQVNATSGILTHYFYVFVQVVSPDFSVQLSQSLAVSAGGSAQSTITLKSLNGFNGTVTLSMNGFLPSGVTATFGNSSLQLSAGTSAITTLNVTAASSVNSQTFYLSIQATSGNLTRNTFVYIIVTSPDFSVTASPSFLSVPRGSSSTTTVSISGFNGFHGNVTLSAPPVFGLSLSLAPMNVTLLSGGSATSTLTVAVPSSTPPGSYEVFVSGTNGALFRGSYVQVQVTGTSFTLSANPSFLILNPGQNAVSTIQVSTINGFSGVVGLSLRLFGLNATLSPSSVTLNSTITSATSTVMLTVPVHTLQGHYGVIVTGSGDGFNQTVNVAVFVNGFDFAMFAQPSPVTVFQGSSNTSTVSLSSINAFNGTVTLSELTFPPDAGLSASLSTSTLFVSNNHTSTSILTISASSSTATGSYSVEINAVGLPQVGPLIVHSTIVQVTVALKPDFQISATPTSLSLVQDTSNASILSLRAMNLFSATVTLNATVSLQGLSVSFAENSIPLSGNLTVDTRLIVSAGTNVVGYFTVTVTAEGGGVVHSIVIQVYVAPKPDFALSAGSSSLTVRAGSSVSEVLSLVSMNGFDGPVLLFPIFSVPGVSITPNTLTVSLSSGGTANATMTVDASVATSPGTYTVTFTGDGAGLAHSASVILTVLPPPDFSLTPSTFGLNLAAGTSASLNVSISPINGFTGSVALSSVAPTGLTDNFSPNPVLAGSGTSNLTLSVLSTVAPGNYTVTVTGVSGSFTHSVTIHVTVSAPSKVTLTVSQVSWAHRLSLRRSGGAETWTMTVKNTGTAKAYFQIGIAGNSTSSALSFSVRSPVAVLAPGASMTIALSQPFTNASIGSKYNFTVNLYYGSGTYPSGSIISPSTSLVTSSTFAVAN